MGVWHREHIMGGVNVEFCLEYTHHFEVLPILLSEEPSFLAPCGIVNDDNTYFVILCLIPNR